MIIGATDEETKANARAWVNEPGSGSRIFMSEVMGWGYGRIKVTVETPPYRTLPPALRRELEERAALRQALLQGAEP